MRLPLSDMESAQWYHAVFPFSKTIWKKHKSRRNVLCKKGRLFWIVTSMCYK